MWRNSTKDLPSSAQCKERALKQEICPEPWALWWEDQDPKGMFPSPVQPLPSWVLWPSQFTRLSPTVLLFGMEAMSLPWIDACVSLHSCGQSGAMCLATDHSSLRISRGIKSPEIYKCHGWLCPARRNLGLQSHTYRRHRSLSHKCVQARTPRGGYLTQTRSHFRQKIWQLSS